MSLSRMVFSSGRSIELSELRLSSTYGGMLEDYPCRPVNDLKIKRSPAGRRSVSFHPPVSTRTGQRVRSALSRCCPPWPAAAHSAQLQSDPDHDPVLYRSALTLTLIRLQPTPDVPSGGGADLAVRDIRWEKLARDYELQRRVSITATR